jgi:hypothetical protein
VGIMSWVSILFWLAAIFVGLLFLRAVRDLILWFIDIMTDD